MKPAFAVAPHFFTSLKLVILGPAPFLWNAQPLVNPLKTYWRGRRFVEALLAHHVENDPELNNILWTLSSDVCNAYKS